MQSAPQAPRPHSGGPPRGEGRSGAGRAEGRAVRAAASGNTFRKKKVCRFCVERVDFIDYKKVEMLQPFVQDRGKIMPRRMTGTCSKHQRWLGVAIKRARNIALLPFATELIRIQTIRSISRGEEELCKLFCKKTSKSWARAAKWWT